MRQFRFDPGRLPSMPTVFGYDCAVILPTQLATALGIEPQSYVCETIGREKSIIFTKYDGDAEPGRCKKIGVHSTMLVSSQWKAKISARFCRQLELKEGDTLIFYLDLVAQQLILRPYDPVEIALQQLKHAQQLIGDLASEKTSVSYYKALRMLKDAEQVIMDTKKPCSRKAAADRPTV